MVIVEILIVLLLVFIVYQDFKYRGISWMVFPICFILFAIYSYFNNELYISASYFGINLSVLLIIFAILSAYYSVKQKKLTNIINRFIGAGDILFMLIMTLAFSPVNFILFFNFSLLLVLILFVVLKPITKIKQDNIPLAGFLSISYVLFVAINKIFFNINPYVDLSIFTV